MKEKSSSGFTAIVLLAAVAGGGLWWWKKGTASAPGGAAGASKAAALPQPVEMIIKPGTQLMPGQDYWSVGRTCRLVFQRDGNIGFYDDAGKVLWDARSVGATHCYFGGDGHFFAANDKTLFSSHTYGRGDSLAVLDSRRVEIRDAVGNVIWSVPNGRLSGLAGTRAARIIV